LTHPARDLGMARRLLYEIAQFYRAYAIMHTLRAELSWGQCGVPMRVEDARPGTFYEDLAGRNG